VPTGAVVPKERLEVLLSELQATGSRFDLLGRIFSH